MACRGLKSLNASRFTNPTELLRELQMQIDDLKNIAAETDFSNPRESHVFSENIQYIKRYFEAYNRLIERNE